MTTDTFRKEVALELDLGRKGRIRIGGMCKGAGMIHPRLATMLAFITTDATLRASRLRELLRGAADRTFNRISVDGDCSTNDTVLLMANGAAGVAIPERGKMFQRFRDGLTEVCRRLAEMIVKDGEGATKFVTVEVSGARNGREAHLAAVAVADSTLVKTAWFGQDLNWGRMVAAVGYSGAKVDPDRISIFLNGLAVVDNGSAVPDRYFARAAREMRRRELHFLIDLRIGRGRDRVLTCDLSEEYVRRNARYTS
jgi:glutamate N-acetyltransferase/amino-acid N-acetyltransferase